jgi:hypothetical protein
MPIVIIGHPFGFANSSIVNSCPEKGILHQYPSRGMKTKPRKQSPERVKYLISWIFTWLSVYMPNRISHDIFDKSAKE